MIFVDSSVWIDFFHGRHSLQTRWLRTHLPSTKIVTGELVLVEVLQGFRNDREFLAARTFLLGLTRMPIASERIALAAADHYRILRTRGITVRKTIDVLIATRCIAEGWALLYSDRDFDPFVEYLGLRPALD